MAGKTFLPRRNPARHRFALIFPESTSLRQIKKWESMRDKAPPIEIELSYQLPSEMAQTYLLVVPALGTGEGAYFSRAVCRHDGSLVPVEDIAARLALLPEGYDRAALVDYLAACHLYRHLAKLLASLRHRGRLRSMAGEGLSPGSPSPGSPCSCLTALRPLSTCSLDSQPSPSSLCICSSIPASASSSTSLILAASYLMPRSTELLLTIFSSTSYHSVRRRFLSSSLATAAR
jgi:hypothetical protein